MNEAIAAQKLDWDSTADTTLKAAAAFWFLVAVTGQWAFVYFIVAFYGGPTLQGDFEAWNANTMLIDGHLSGDTVGNLFFAAHVLMAAVVTVGGTLQLIPQLRARALSFHRWNGRFFILTATAIALAGLKLVWLRGTYFNLVTASGISLNALLILICAGMAWHHARAREIGFHRRWAMRTFMVVNGVWFLRVGIMACVIVNQGPVGGRFVEVMSFASYLLPIVVLELYFLAQNRGDAAGKLGMAGGLFLLAAFMAVGIFGAFMFMWRPLI